MAKRHHPITKVPEPARNDKIKAYLDEYEALCEKHELALVAHGRIQSVEGSIFKVVGVWSVEPYQKKETKNENVQIG